MTTVLILVDFLLEALFLTNIWIILYSKLIDYLNFIRPPTAVQTLGNPIANPEIFEVPLYIFLSLFFIGGIWFYHIFVEKLTNMKTVFATRKVLFIKFLFLLFLFLLFVGRLGNFPLSGDSYPHPLQSDKIIYLAVFLAYLLAIILITAQATILERIFKKRIFFVCIYIFLTIVTGILVFEPQFHITPLDGAFFYGPVWEVAHGKLIFTEFPSVYGFFSILFFSLIYKLSHINFYYLPLLIWVLYILEYIISFHLIWKVGKNLPLAVLGLFSLA